MKNKIPLDMQVGTVHPTDRFGDIEVVEYFSAGDVVVKFLKSGTETRTHSSMIRKGNVKDRNVPQVYGVGFVGEGPHVTSINNKPTPSYTCWLRMVRRCYDEKYHARFPCYLGCSVNPVWHNFQNFAKWFEENHPNDGLGYDLDKDIKIDGNKEYSPLACVFATQEDNKQKAHAKHFSFKSPDGYIVNIYNLRKFSLANNLIPGHMSSVHNGSRKSHKGWKKA